MYLAVVGAGHDVAGVQLHVLGRVALHEPLALSVVEATTFAPDRLGYEHAGHLLWLYHPGGVKLDELHVSQRRPGLVGQGHRIPGVLAGARGAALVQRGQSAGGEYDGPCTEEQAPTGVQVVACGTGYTAFVRIASVSIGGRRKELCYIYVLTVGYVLLPGFIDERVEDRLAGAVAGEAGAPE